MDAPRRVEIALARVGFGQVEGFARASSRPGVRMAVARVVRVEESDDRFWISSREMKHHDVTLNERRRAPVVEPHDLLDDLAGEEIQPAKSSGGHHERADDQPGAARARGARAVPQIVETTHSAAVTPIGSTTDRQLTTLKYSRGMSE